MEIKVWWPLSFLCAIIIACVLIFPSELKLADLLGKAGKVEEAIQSFEEILLRNPHRQDLRIDLGKLYLAHEEPQKAVKEFEKAITLVAADTALLNTMVDIYSTLRDIEGCVRTLERLAAINPVDVHYRKKLAAAYEWNRDLNSAITLYEQLLATDQNNPEYLKKLFSLNLSFKKYDATIRYLEAFLKVRHDDLEARLLLGNVYLAVDRRQYAAQEFESVLRKKPEDEKLRVKLAELYIWMQKSERGVLHYEYLLMHHILNDAYFNRAIELTRDYAPERAIKYFTYRMNYLPNKNSLRERFVDLTLYLGLTDEALQQLQILIKNNPENVHYLRRLAGLYKNTQRPLLAVSTYEKILNMGHPDKDILDELIIFYKNEKKYSRLLDLYRRLENKSLLDAGIQRDYADVLILTRRYEQAITRFAEQMRIDPQNPHYRIQLAKLFAHTGNEKGAFKTVREGVVNYRIQDESFLLFSAHFFDQRKIWDGSVICYLNLVTLNNHNLEYKRSLADAYIKTNQFELAAKIYEELLEEDQDDFKTHFELASLYWQSAEFDKMHTVMDDVQKTFSDRPQLHREAGRFYFERSLFDDAIEHLQAELTLSPQDSAAQRMLGLAYAWNNQPEKAKQVLKAYHQFYVGDVYTHYQMGVLFSSEGKKHQGTEEFYTALELLDRTGKTKERAIITGRIYAQLKEAEQVKHEFENLIERYPNDLDIYAEYAGSLLELKDYKQADEYLTLILDQQPNHDRGLRLRSRWYFERGDYGNAAKTLTLLSQQPGADIGVKLDLADAQRASGDWYASQETLQSLLRQAPRNRPAFQRLTLLRREKGESISTKFQVEEQSGNYLKVVYDFIVEKATSSFLYLKMLFGKESYTDKSLAFTADREKIGLQVNSRFNSKLQTTFGMTADQIINTWTISGDGALKWHLNELSSVTLTSRINALWNDPLAAVFQNGRVNAFYLDSHFQFFQKLQLRGRLSYESHRIQKDRKFGAAQRAQFHVGYSWRQRPLLYTYYETYSLRYTYENPGNINIIAIPENERIHYFGGILNRQLTPRLYTQLSGSIGFNTERNSFLYLGILDLEYMLFKQVRLRSHFAYGSQNRLTGNDNNKSLWFDLYYFY
ncbi:MAG: tetratricopeptide repeat protein [bacterium]